MERIPSHYYNEMIGLAIRQIGPEAMRLIGDVHFLCGVDPFFAGVSDKFEYDASYVLDASCWDGKFTGDGTTTIVLPSDWHSWVTVVHELGHALDFKMGQTVLVKPVTEYAETDRLEAFAESFMSFVVGPNGGVEGTFWEDAYSKLIADGPTYQMFSDISDFDWRFL